MAKLGFTDNDGLDVGDKYVTKEYLIDRYPNIAIHSNMPSMWTWGIGSSGQLGDNVTAAGRSTSSPGTVFGGASNWKVVDANYHVLATRQDGTLWTWGSNVNGELGTGNTTSRSSPGTTQGTAATTWVKVSAGTRFSLAIQNNGTLWSWGLNTSGQLGTGNTTNRSSPSTTIGGSATADTWQQIATADKTALAIKTDGNLYTWGYGGNGELGSNAITNRSSPVTVVGGLTNWNFVAGGLQHCVGITNDGKLWSWGAGNSGQLGDGTLGAKSSPVTTAGGGTNWKLASCGYSHTVAVKTDGSIWTWGLNTNRQLGNGTTVVARSSPDSVAGGGLNWVRVHAGAATTCAIKTDGTLWMWGGNINGECGDGTSVDRSSPVQTVLPVTSWKIASIGNSVSIGIKEEDDW